MIGRAARYVSAAALALATLGCGNKDSDSPKKASKPEATKTYACQPSPGAQGAVQVKPVGSVQATRSVKEDTIAYTFAGPVGITFAEDACLPVEQMSFTHGGGARNKPRNWSVKLVVKGFYRSALLKLFEAGVSPMGPDRLIRFTIDRQVELTYSPRPELAARLDMVEDKESIAAKVGLDNRILGDALDLRNYEFQGAVQE